MADDAIKDLVSQGLAAAKSGSQVAAKATAEIQNDAKHPDLKAALQQGNETSKQWSQRIDQAVQEVGGVPAIENQILQAHYDVSKKIRQDAKDDQSRDLGIIAAGQLALHYWIASFGTLQSYAAKVGMTQTADNMRKSVEEAKQADEQHTQLARSIMG
ncbi:DUF892 family protein [Aureimonas jatrophae]|uniref:Ferritin-like metal-binding protein YciE n=1 Tax=Aureimonas jatrophae TaxID=1166073 RepID=A0A1H0DDI9_9HYPH|nr:DUF892 family protein [Aureimonas jatrophae]MBB3951825.1 ferritin-like metal-binding protein YciE [Aureimonas jatrophae]SDN68066.1 Ferritin-like metal-binding protein YciE [Aureimonas jatrophae]